MGETCTGAPENCTDKSEQQPLTRHLNACSQGCPKGERMVLIENKERSEKASGGVRPREHDKEIFSS